jgi:hypothetical protein
VTTPPPIRVNPAPVLTLWAAVVAERLGYEPEAALSLASAVAGTAAQARAVRPGGTGLRTVMLLGHEVPVRNTPDGALRACDAEGRPAEPEPVRRYLERAFGTRLAEARSSMEALAAQVAPPELNRMGHRLFDAFRPEMPESASGFAVKGRLRLERIGEAASAGS